MFKLFGVYDMGIKGHVGKIGNDITIENVETINWEENFDTVLFSHAKELEILRGKQIIHTFLEKAMFRRKIRLCWNERIKECIESNGIVINDDGTFDELDSIKFISSIVNIEQEFDIEIPDEYLLIETMSSFENIKTIICEVLQSKNKE
jgi:acyl carrier protein